MRFGISEGIASVVLQRLSTATSPAEIADIVAAFRRVDAAREQVELGFRLIEIGGDSRVFLPESFSDDNITALLALKAEYDLAYTCHLPLWSIEPASPLAGVRNGSVDELVEGIRLAEPLQPETYVVHATGALASEFTRRWRSLPEIPGTWLLDAFQDAARAGLDALLSRVDIDPKRIAIETVEFPLDRTIRLAEEFGVSMCFDTGHVLVGFSGPVAFFDGLEQALPHIAEFHLHDGIDPRPEFNVVYGTDHQPLGSGDLDVGAFLDRIEAFGFDGPIIFELTNDEALASIEAIRNSRPHLHPQEFLASDA